MKTSNLTLPLTLFVLAIAWIIVVPITAIYAINILFSANIEISFVNWVCVTFLLNIINGGASANIISRKK